jgi:malate dehydrogenase (oxaloacetate-decarboxylating)
MSNPIVTDEKRCEMADIYQKSLEQHRIWKGKLRVIAHAPINDRAELALAYTPGVAAACLAIQEDPKQLDELTWVNATVAVISDGSAVLGLGNIGPKAGMPVMEGKAALFARFAGLNAVPICLDTQDTEEIILICKALAPSFGGINLEDISAPRCVTIERRLKAELDIPVFHDDQHGTAIIVLAGLINCLRLTGKDKKDMVVTVSGTGAAGSSILKLLYDYGFHTLYAFNKQGLVTRVNAIEQDFLQIELSTITNPLQENLSFAQALAKSDVFVGVSASGLVNYEMAQSMKKDAVIFAMANPEPEIDYDTAKAAGVRIVGTGRSDRPNQINNVLVFPGLFRGALSSKAKQITEAMKIAAAEGLASLISDDELNDDYIIPDVFDPRVADTVANAVIDEVKRSETDE